MIAVDEIQRLNQQIEALKRELEESQRRERLARREVQHLNEVLETIVHVLACVVISRK